MAEIKINPEIRTKKLKPNIYGSVYSAVFVIAYYFDTLTPNKKSRPVAGSAFFVQEVWRAVIF